MSQFYREQVLAIKELMKQNVSYQAKRELEAANREAHLKSFILEQQKELKRKRAVEPHNTEASVASSQKRQWQLQPGDHPATAQLDKILTMG